MASVSSASCWRRSRRVAAGVAARWVGKASRLAAKQLASNMEVSPLPQSSIAPSRQPRLLPPNPDEAWPEDVWDVLPAECSVMCCTCLLACSSAGLRRRSDGHEHCADHTRPSCSQGRDLHSSILPRPGPAQPVEPAPPVWSCGPGCQLGLAAIPGDRD